MTPKAAASVTPQKRANAVPLRQRRLPAPHEQERRKAWGAEWSQVGKDWKRQQTAKGR